MVVRGGDNRVGVVAGAVSVEGIGDHLRAAFSDETFWLAKAGNNFESDKAGYVINRVLSKGPGYLPTRATTDGRDFETLAMFSLGQWPHNVESPLFKGPQWLFGA